MIRAIALDDEPPALRVLTHFCQQVDFIDLQQTFTRTDEAQQHITQSEVDLLFLDINMPFISGTDFYRAISAAEGTPPMVIFTTAYAEYAVEGFELNALDYLLKPFTFERFLQAVTKANDYSNWQQRSKPADDYLYIRADYTIYKIAYADILLIEGLDDYLKVHLASTNHPIVARLTMKAILEKLSDDQFIRVHRSFIVPFKRIEGIRNKTIRLADRDVPIGASYEAALLNRFRS
ncbi:LytR/AlgR family response regulator transcription factor [Fibrella forsythiae]|uniref:Response regulator transcription factor n=1 Tax=Fibrella forsythiae TaxID=2817061 RepID=A0ABS3JPR4_9BACT|nr:LytTR family DNA-binding domain-containing protein [Fibrella forsythiae]MBO0951987.1 response regulator transcription factor [Fibrella forsythiae]